MEDKPKSQKYAQKNN